jgi:hypothetical protein
MLRIGAGLIATLMGGLERMRTTGQTECCERRFAAA